MEVKQNFKVSISVLVGLLLLVLFSAVSLLERMVPAAQNILAENVYSLTAIEDMLAELPFLRPDNQVSLGRFQEALIRAKKNITIDAEEYLLDSIESTLPMMVEGNIDAKARVARNLIEVAKKNRDSISLKARNAERLGLAGAWTLVFLGVIGLVVSMLVYQNISRRIIIPLSELCSTLSDWRNGNNFRRCDCSGASHEISQAMGIINQLFDEKTTAFKQKH